MLSATKAEAPTQLTYGIWKYVMNSNLLALKQKSIGGLTRYLSLPMITGHDQAAAARAPVPAPAELKADIDALDNWVSTINKRRQ